MQTLSGLAFAAQKKRLQLSELSKRREKARFSVLAHCLQIGSAMDHARMACGTRVILGKKGWRVWILDVLLKCWLLAKV